MNNDTISFWFQAVMVLLMAALLALIVLDKLVGWFCSLVQAKRDLATMTKYAVELRAYALRAKAAYVDAATRYNEVLGELQELSAVSAPAVSPPLPVASTPSSPVAVAPSSPKKAKKVAMVNMDEIEIEVSL